MLKLNRRKLSATTAAGAVGLAAFWGFGAPAGAQGPTATGQPVAAQAPSQNQPKVAPAFWVAPPSQADRPMAGASRRDVTGERTVASKVGLF